MWLADTTFIIDLINNDEGAVEKAKNIDRNRSIVFISAITVQEYLSGIYYLFGNIPEQFDEKLTRAEGDLARFSGIDLNYNVAKAAAKIDADLTRNGEQIGYADVLIGATAHFYQLTLLTRNKNHFKRIPGLQVESY
ncbi:MAG: PIN domain-containing protein [Candidatus Hodarchaeales archaeon]